MRETRKLTGLALITLTALTILAVGALGSSLAQGPPTLSPVAPYSTITPQPADQTVIHTDNFITTDGAWYTFAEPPSSAEIARQDGELLLRIDGARDVADGVLRPIGDLPAPPDGMTLTLSAEGRVFRMVVGVREADGSWYHTHLQIDPAEGTRTFEVDFAWLRLDQNSTDENGVLDHDQISDISLVDITGFVGPIGPGVVRIEEVTFWQGRTALPLARCSVSTPTGDNFLTSDDFLTGADASYIPLGEQYGGLWYAQQAEVDPLALLAANGVNALRLRVWVGESGESKMDQVLPFAERAVAAGMQVYPVLFLADDWTDVNKQDAPAIWADLALEQRAVAIRAYTEDTVTRLLATGITVPYYEIGNEIDYGIAGVFAEPEQRDLATLRADIWPQTALLVQAAVEGIRAADPDARIMLHIAQSYDPVFSVTYFHTMRELGVDYDIAGLSYYPTSLGPLSYPQFCATVDRLDRELGLPIVLAEYAYPAEPPTGGAFGAWYNDLPGYPLSPPGQAQFVADFLADLRAHPAVIGAYYFSPTLHWIGELWGPFALFDPAGRARPAVGAFASP
ncbi:MAG: hypothetical protein GYB65_17845 [Chloroflexi bacterium]|nr:hypothetical protein [Chloroflexota bacterium]